MKNQLNESQRIHATGLLFMEFERFQKENKISKEDYEITLQGDIEKDADAMYIVLKKNNLISQEFENKLQNLKVIEYLKELKIEDIKNQSTLNQSRDNAIKLGVLEKQAARYRDMFVHGGKEFKFSEEFIANQKKEKEELQKKDNNEKSGFISGKIQKLKKIGESIIDIDSTITKENKLKNIEKDIAEFHAMIQQLKDENRILKRELELIVEQQEKSSQKEGLVKENRSLKEKIEKINKEPMKINKITYGENEKER